MRCGCTRRASAFSPSRTSTSASSSARTWPIVRSERQWDWISGDPYKEKVYRYLLGDETGAHAYIVFKPEGDGDGRKAVVRDLAYDSREALYGLLGFLYRLGAQYAFISGVFPDEIDFLDR